MENKVFYRLSFIVIINRKYLDESEQERGGGGRSKQHRLFSQHRLDETADAQLAQLPPPPVQNVHLTNGLKQVLVRYGTMSVSDDFPHH
jgi:hypothetical protein